ncbi:MAG: hypothetical protein JWO67_6473 [Streptosporangiaceae bacterium]|nr:hypothetical protein [Streptosporangiaceae bacterium]
MTGDGGSVRVGFADGQVRLAVRGRGVGETVVVKLSAEGVQSLVSALIAARREAFGSDWPPSLS